MVRARFQLYSRGNGTMSDEDTTRQFSPEGYGQQGRKLDDLFSLVQSLRGEFTEFRDRVEVRLLRTTPMSETLERSAVLGELKERLRRAIENEQFELAADLRDRIRTMEVSVV